MLEDMEAPDAPLQLFPVQLLQRISPWLPFFHMDEEFVLQTAQHGFRPSGIVNAQRDDTKKLIYRAAQQWEDGCSFSCCWTSTNRCFLSATERSWTLRYDIRLIKIITTASNATWVVYFCSQITAIATYTVLLLLFASVVDVGSSSVVGWWCQSSTTCWTGGINKHNLQSSSGSGVTLKSVTRQICDRRGASIMMMSPFVTVVSPLYLLFF